MKNLKKVLSLVLALAMALSLMTVAFAKDAADYDDYAAINHKEAVDVLTALNVINGKEDGSNFDPTGSVTRAEMAKMITVIALGDVDVSAFKGTTTDLKDINNWAEAYIKYCYSQGVIAGRGNGTFAPNDKVTAAEAAKMLLVAIGYNAKVQVYEGGNWKINTIRDAQLSGFFEDLAVTADKFLTRDEAAQMIYNAVDATLIQKTSIIDRVDGSISDSYAPYADGRDLLSETFGVREDEGILADFTYDSEDEEYTYSILANRDNDADLESASFTTATDYTDLFRQNVKVLYKNNKDGTETVYGIYAEGSSVIVETAVNALDLDALTDDADELEVGDVEYKVDAGAVEGAYAFGSTTCDMFRTVGAMDNFMAFTVRFLDTTDNGKIDTVVYFPTTVAKVTYLGTTSITMDNGIGNNKLEDIELAADIAKDDMVLVTAAANTAKGVMNVAKADVVSGKVEATKGTDKIQVNGTWYMIANNASMLGNTYDLTVVNGYVCYADATSSSVSLDDYAVVIKKQGSASWDADNALSVLLFADGTTKTVAVEDADKGICDALVTFEVSDDVYDLTPATLDTTDTSATYCGFDVAGNNSNSSYDVVKDKLTIAGTPYAVADDAAIFVQVSGTPNKYKVISGAELKKLDAVTKVVNAYGTKDSATGFTTINMAFITTTSDDASDDTAYGYVTSDLVGVKDADGNTVYQITMGDVTLTTKNGVDVTGIQKGSVVSYKLTDGVITTLAEIADTTAQNGGFAVTAYNGELLNVSVTPSVYEITEDTVIIYIDSAEKTVVDGGAIALAVKDSNNNYVENITFATKQTADATTGYYEINVLVVDVNNNFYDKTIA